MFYRNTEITEKTVISLPVALKTMNDISIVMTLSEIPTKRCGLYSITQQRTLGVDGNGHLCYWFYDGSNDRCLNGVTVLSGTDVKVGVVHSRKGVRLYVNGNLDAFCEAPLWSANCNNSYIGTHGLAPSDLEMDGEIGGVLLVDYAMSDEEMSAVNWNSELYVVNNHLYYAPSKTTLHLDDSLASSFSDGSMYALEDSGSIVISDEEKLPCWYLGEYNSTTQDITLNISDKRGGGTYNRMEVDHLMVHSIGVVDTGHTVEDDNDEDGVDAYPYLAINESNNAIFTNPHIDTMKVEYHCSEDPVSESDLDTITVWGSSYDDTFPYIYAKYTIAYKDGASGIIVTTVRDPNHEQYMVRTVTCYVETTASTYTWPTDPTLFDSGTALSFFDRNAHAGKYQFTRQWTWFGEEWHATDHDTVPTSSIEGFTSGHWVSGSETALFVVDDDYLRNIVVVEDVVSQSIKDYASSHSQPVSSYMGSKQLPSDLPSGYALKDSTGSLQANNCYFNEIHADGFDTTVTRYSDNSGWYLVTINSSAGVDSLSAVIAEGACLKDLYNGEGSLIYKDSTISMTKHLFDKFEKLKVRPLVYSDGNSDLYLKNWFSDHSDFGGTAYLKFLSKLAEHSSNPSSTIENINKLDGKPKLFSRIGISFDYNGSRHSLVTYSDSWIESELMVDSTTNNLGVVYNNVTMLNSSNVPIDFMIKLLVSKASADSIRITALFGGAGSSFSSITLPASSITTHKYITGISNESTVLPFGIISVDDIASNYYSYEISYDLKVFDGTVYAHSATPLYIQNNASFYLNGAGWGNKNYEYSYIFRDPFTNVTTEVTVSTTEFPYPIKVQIWRNVRGEAFMRSLLPFDNTDQYVARNGSTIGSSDRMWDSVFTKALRDGKRLLLRPYNFADFMTPSITQHEMFLYDDYMVTWGTGKFFSSSPGTVQTSIVLNHRFKNEDYILFTSNGHIANKMRAGFIVASGSDDLDTTFDWIAIGKMG